MQNLKGGLIILSVFLTVLVKGQDAAFSQFYAAGLYLNPALVGSEQETTFKSSYRTQWRNITLPYVTSQMSLIKPLRGSRLFRRPRESGPPGDTKNFKKTTRKKESKKGGTKQEK